MRRWILRFLQLFYLKFGWAQIVCPPEANDAIQRCVLPVKEYAEALGMSVRDASLSGQMDRLLPPVQAVEMFQELCHIITRFEFCVKEAKSQCPRHIVLNLIDVSYGYLCNEGFEPFMDNANCLMQLDQDKNIRSCHESTMKSIVSVNQDNNTSMDQKMARTCRSLNYFATCIENHVRNKCGVTAWAVIVRVLKDTTTTLMANCVFTVQVPDLVQNQNHQNSNSNRLEPNPKPHSKTSKTEGPGPQYLSNGSSGPNNNHLQNEAPVYGNKAGQTNDGMKSGQNAIFSPVVVPTGVTVLLLTLLLQFTRLII